LSGQVLLHLVRHGRPVIVPGAPASSWPLDDSTGPDLRRMRRFLEDNVSSASWHSSDEPKALATARALTDREPTVDPALREAVRADWFADHEELRTAVFRGFDAPHRAACPGWESFDRTRDRIGRAVARIVEGSRTDVVLVGHGTAWTLLVSEITGSPPDLDSWRRLGMPDLCTLDLASGSVARAWGAWEWSGDQ
jgi:broad specificity phosphatase PhoE